MWIQAGFVNSNEPVAKVHPADFEEAAKRACQTTLKEAKSIYPRVEESNLPYICMDLVYQYTLLVDGFGKCHMRCIRLRKLKMEFYLLNTIWIFLCLN